MELKFIIACQKYVLLRWFFNIVMIIDCIRKIDLSSGRWHTNNVHLFRVNSSGSHTYVSAAWAPSHPFAHFPPLPPTFVGMRDHLSALNPKSHAKFPRPSFMRRPVSIICLNKDLQMRIWTSPKPNGYIHCVCVKYENNRWRIM